MPFLVITVKCGEEDVIDPTVIRGSLVRRHLHWLIGSFPPHPQLFPMVQIHEARALSTDRVYAINIAAFTEIRSVFQGHHTRTGEIMQRNVDSHLANGHHGRYW